jgi:hypothetical protein
MGYGNGHAMGGSYHDAILGAVAFAALCGITIAAWIAWESAGRTLDGSVIAARLRDGMPAWHLVALTAGGWLSLAEHLEPRHQPVSPLLLAAAVVVAAWLLIILARALVAFVSAIAIAICTSPFAARANVARLPRRHAAPLRLTLLRVYRRYARPPPTAVAGA